jgi:ribosomal protein L29
MMAVTEPQRLALHAAARSALGDAQGGPLMALVPPANTDIATIQALDRLQMATTADIVAVRTELKTDIAQVRTELKTDIAELRTELKTGIAGLRTELKTGIAELRTELKTGIAELRTELKTGIAAVRLEVAALRSEMLDRLDAFQWRIIGAVVLSVTVATFLDRIL